MTTNLYSVQLSSRMLCFEGIHCTREKSECLVGQGHKTIFRFIIIISQWHGHSGSGSLFYNPLPKSGSFLGFMVCGMSNAWYGNCWTTIGRDRPYVVFWCSKCRNPEWRSKISEAGRVRENMTGTEICRWFGGSKNQGYAICPIGQARSVWLAHKWDWSNRTGKERRKEIGHYRGKSRKPVFFGRPSISRLCQYSDFKS